MIVLRLPIPRIHCLMVHCLRLAEPASRFLPGMHRYLANLKLMACLKNGKGAAAGDFGPGRGGAAVIIWAAAAE